MKFRLYMVQKFGQEDIFKFNTLEELSHFITQYTAEKLIDSDFAELEYYIIVSDKNE